MDTKRLTVLVVDPAVSVFNKHFTVPVEYFPSFKVSADRKFETFFFKKRLSLQLQVQPCIQLLLQFQFVEPQLIGLRQ